MRRLCCVLAALGFVMLAASEPAAASIVVHVDRAQSAHGSHRRRRAALQLAGVDRAARLHHAARHLSSATAGGALVFEANTTTRRCRTRSSSTAATPSTAPTRFPGWAGRCRTAASGSIRATPPFCSAWSSAKAAATPRSWCIGQRRCLSGKPENGQKCTVEPLAGLQSRVCQSTVCTWSRGNREHLVGHHLRAEMESIVGAGAPRSA